MGRMSNVFGRVLESLMLAACLLLLAMTLIIGADVITRNTGLGGIAWSGEASEDIIYLLTLMAAPWLLRQGQHIRVDILLRALPGKAAWLMEWAGDILGLACSLYFVWYGWQVLAASYAAGAITIKTLITPEWWMLAPLPASFLLLAIEFLCRMHRLARAERVARTDAVSAS
ncbi:MAG: TRAP transporter small permease [Hyphomicrobiaceae bacterium]|nr:TRAP transporter small permease [Hyphomicrobiaceae bacterium]